MTLHPLCSIPWSGVETTVVSHDCRIFRQLVGGCPCGVAMGRNRLWPSLFDQLWPIRHWPILLSVLSCFSKKDRTMKNMEERGTLLGGTPKGVAPKGAGPTKKNGARRGGAPKGGGPIPLFFPLSRHHFKQQHNNNTTQQHHNNNNTRKFGQNTKTLILAKVGWAKGVTRAESQERYRRGQRAGWRKSGEADAHWCDQEPSADEESRNTRKAAKFPVYGSNRGSTGRG